MHFDIENSEDLAPHLQRMVDHGVNGLDIMHGELKNLMLMADARFTEAALSFSTFPTGDYGNLGAASVDAFGISVSPAFDCLTTPTGAVSEVDLGVL